MSLSDIERETVLRRIATTKWPFELLVQICDGWDGGESTTRMGRRLGLSKNAIVGKAHRLMAYNLLNPKPSPIIRGPNGPQTLEARRAIKALHDANRTAPHRSTLPPLPSVAALPVFTVPLPPRPARIKTPSPFSDRVYRPVVVSAVPAPRPYGRVVDCCWPIGDVGTKEFRYCDMPSDPGRPYCEAHVKIAYSNRQPSSDPDRIFGVVKPESLGGGMISRSSGTRGRTELNQQH